MVEKRSSAISPQRAGAAAAGLSPAHKGYHYQDQVASLFFARSLVEPFDEITVESKAVDDDRFDDLSVLQHSKETRRQFKSSDDPTRVLRRSDLLAKRHRIRIDDLVHSYQRAGTNAASEYRLCATWLTPNEAELLKLIEPITADSSFPGHPTKMFRLRAELIWPAGQPPVWRPLRDASGLKRQDFVAFAERFIIELECPPASRDFAKPGALEYLVLGLLGESIGIGRYPHQNRSEVDVAAVLQQYAYRARSEGLTVKPTDVERELQLHKDFGRVEQEFPILPSTVIKRAFLRRELTKRLGAGYVIVEGTPGSGKSWELSGLATDLSAEGYMVARHYCYLEPGDPQVQRRITTEVMFGNLIYDLVKANPALEKLHRPAYAAGRRELEDLLRKAAEQGLIEKAALIVDGVDHISRVFADSTGVTRNEIDIVEELAALNLPAGVSVIIGTQPGVHLDPLRDRAEFVEMPSWRIDEIANLSNRLGLPGRLRRVGLKRDIVKQFLVELHERSEGNPLYATFLCRFTLEQIASGAALDPVGGLRNTPLTGGDISVYYAHLMKSAAAAGATQPIAELLGLIDFGLTEQELKEMLPAWAHHVDDALSHLSPILAPARSQTGIRIYHESFRRFIKQRLLETNGSLPDILDPVIAWLKRRDFFDDSRTYRFLLPTLRRAGCYRELLDLVGADFVWRSVEAGHARKAVEQNLLLATYIAAEELAWADLVRCIELQRSCTVCFEDKLTDYGLFGRAFAAVYGADKLAERMLFDGQPVFGARQGLLFCSLCDDAEVVAPWAQYLSRPENDDDEQRGADKEWVSDALAEIHGLIRLEGGEAIYDRIVSWLERVTKPEPRYFRGILKRLKEFGGTEALEALLSEATMAPEVRALVQVELADSLFANSNLEEAATYATEAVKNSADSGVAVECLLLGADHDEVAKRCPDLDGFGVGNEKYYDPKATALRIWVEGVRITAAVDPSRLASLEAKIPGEGWYSNWLRFVIELARAEEQASTNPSAAEVAIMAAVAFLASDTERFKGDPRPCDLYSQRTIIHETIARALRLIHSAENFETALTHLAEISQHTTSYLNNSPGGPLIPENFIEILMLYVMVSNFKRAAMAELKRQQEKVRQGDELYDTRATADLLLARASAMAGEDDVARQLWQSAAIHLCAYGYRRELSILDLTESAPALARCNAGRARESMAAAQPLSNAVDSHTDGKETQYAPIYWAGSLGKIDPPGAAYVVGHSIMRHGGVIDWRHENGFEEVIDATRETASPSLVAFLDATLPRAGRPKAIEVKLATLERLIAEDRDLGTSLLRVLVAKGRATDSQGLLEKTLSAAIGRTVPAESPTTAELAESEDHTTPSTFLLDRFFRSNYSPIFDSEATPLNLLMVIRSDRRLDVASDPGQNQFLNAFGYRLIEMINGGEETEVIRLLTSLARETHFWESATLLADIGEGLNRHGHKRVASVAFALAYARSRGDRGYLFLGDDEQLPWFITACELSLDDAWRTLANEVAYLVAHQGHYQGITRHVIRVLASGAETSDAAFGAWNSVYGVLNERLPRNEADYYIFEKYDPAVVPAWSVDEALVFLLLARMCHPELGRKTSALVGLLEIVASQPTIVIKPLTEFLSRDTVISSALLVLHALLLAETQPFLITMSLQDELRSLYLSGLFGLRVIAQQLLERAGLDLGPARRAPTFAERTVPARKREAILSLDWGSRSSNIARVWSDFPDILSARFHDKWENSEALKERARKRHEAARSRGYDNLPQTKLMYWEVETFEMMFHEVLEGIDEELWRSGEWDPDALPWLVQRVLPQLPLHAARWHSRSSRPDLPLPRESSNNVTTPVPISSSDEFDGWYRCGYYEREFVIRGMFHVDDDISVMSGIHFAVAPDDLDPSVTPLAQGRAEVWLDGVDSSSWSDLTVRSDEPRPITGLDFVRDWLGDFPVLMLQPYLQVRHGLRPSGSRRLELVDADGKVAAAFRHWEERVTGESVGEEVPRLRGCELLLRPDVFDRMSRNSHPPPLTVTQRFQSSRSADVVSGSRDPEDPPQPNPKRDESGTGQEPLHHKSETHGVPASNLA